MDIWLALAITVAALIVGYVFGTRQAGGHISMPELARLWERHLAAETRADPPAATTAEAYRNGLRDMARALVIGDPPPPSDRV
jgi:hypothetical protein